MDHALDFFGEDITGVDDAWDVCHVSKVCLLRFTYFDVTKVNVFGAFVCHGRCPVDVGLVVVVDDGAMIGFRHV